MENEPSADSRRIRFENARTITPTIGISTAAIRVSRQFSQNSQASRPTITALSRTRITETAASVCVTLLTSLTSLAISWPADSRAKKLAGIAASRANMSRRRSVSTRWLIHVIA